MQLQMAVNINTLWNGRINNIEVRFGISGQFLKRLSASNLMLQICNKMTISYIRVQSHILIMKKVKSTITPRSLIHGFLIFSKITRKTVLIHWKS